MGSLFGALLYRGGHEVTLVDVARPAVEAINTAGLQVEFKYDGAAMVPVPAVTDPASVGQVDVVIVFVKCYHTEAALRSALPLLGPQTSIVSLQNGWGNVPRIAAIAGEERVVAGVTYHSGTLVGPGHVKQTGVGMTYIGELDGQMSQRLAQLAAVLASAGIDVTPSQDVLSMIWAKLALNCCTLPTSALLRFYAHQLVEHEGVLNLMQAILREVVTVAHAQQISLDYDERWQAITGLLRQAVGGKASMLQDVEARRRTEIDVINGAIVEAGQRLGIPTPTNQAMLWLVKSLEETF
jgi:2-dehydropantoate 2-reductase